MPRMTRRNFFMGSKAFSGQPDADALLTREYRRPFVVPAENQV